MRIKLWSRKEVKKARIMMYKHILSRWLRLDLKHSHQESYTMDSESHLRGRITGVECNCGKVFYQE